MRIVVKYHGRTAVSVNDDFYSTAFIEEEQNAIFSTTVSTENNPQYGTTNGADTTDKLYLLSAEEVRNKSYGFAMYHEMNSQTRQARNTAFAAAKGAWADEAGNGWWWQRSLGSFPFNVVYAGSEGAVDCSGFIVVNEGGGVRPAMHLNLLSASWKQAGQIELLLPQNWNRLRLRQKVRRRRFLCPRWLWTASAVPMTWIVTPS